MGLPELEIKLWDTSSQFIDLLKEFLGRRRGIRHLEFCNDGVSVTLQYYPKGTQADYGVYVLTKMKDEELFHKNFYIEFKNEGWVILPYKTLSIIKPHKLSPEFAPRRIETLLEELVESRKIRTEQLPTGTLYKGFDRNPWAFQRYDMLEALARADNPNPLPYGYIFNETPLEPLKTGKKSGKYKTITL